jgi:imidazolonepropionase-like amidohydrolase
MNRFFFLLALCSLPVCAQPITKITNATLVDGTGAPPRTATVVIKGERILSISPTSDVEVPPDARIISAEGLTMIPGLFDLHTHLPYSGVNGVSGDWAKVLAAYLLCGVTTVVDFGTYPETFAPMRKLLQSGQVTGPHLLLAARFTTPLGHGAEAGRGDLFSLEVMSPFAARAALRRVLPYHPDVIKIFTDGWRYGVAPDMTSMDADTLTALVDEAHKNNLKVLTHTVTLDRAKIAARAGVDVLAHGIGDLAADGDLIALLKQKGTYYVSTLAVYEPRGRDILTPTLAAVLEPVARAAIQPPLREPASSAQSPSQSRITRFRTLLDNEKALHDAGIPLGSGTDAGVTGTYHGWATLRELKLMVQAGITPLDAITAATRNSAKAVGLDSDRGTIEPGKLADLVLIEGTPHRSINDVDRIRRVFLAGRDLDLKSLAQTIASPAISPLAAQPIVAKIDDFESTGARTWVNGTDPGSDHSRMVFGRIPRTNGRGHALSVMGDMSEKTSPYIRVSVPLMPGGVEPIDVRRYKGVRFNIRGDGDYRLLAITRAIRDYDPFQKSFVARSKWKMIRIPFRDLAQTKGKEIWTGTDLLMLTFEIARPAGKQAWMDLDNVTFY